MSRKLLYSLIAKIVFSKGTSCELVSNSHLILMWKIVARKPIDYAALIISTMWFCSFSFQNLALPYANLLSLIFDHFNLNTDLEEVDYSGPQSFSNNVLPPLGIFKVEGKYELYSNLAVTKKEELQKLHGKKIGRLDPHSKESLLPILASSHLILRFVKSKCPYSNCMIKCPNLPLC